MMISRKMRRDREENGKTFQRNKSKSFSILQNRR